MIPVTCRAIKLSRVKLTTEERAHLTELLSKGKAARTLTRARVLLKAAARTLAHAHILLKVDEGVAGRRSSDEAIAGALDVNRSMVERVRMPSRRGGF